MSDEKKIRNLVSRVVYRTLGKQNPAPTFTRSRQRGLVTELDVNNLPYGGEIRVPKDSIVTPLARQVAMDRHISIMIDSEPASRALSIVPDSRVSTEKIEAAGRHFNPPQRQVDQLVTEQDFEDLPFGGSFTVPPGALVTPLARQVAMDRHITIRDGDSTASLSLAIIPESGVSDERIEKVSRHFQPPQLSTGRLVTELDIKDLAHGSEFIIPPGSIVTPLARQAAMERRITMLKGSQAASPSKATLSTPTPGTGGDKMIAIGADHGGYTLKESLKLYLGELGFSAIDCGTHSEESVDYPDFAFAVAQLVADGRAWRGIIIDGAGIGSCMTANKVPGVRASMCYDQATAANSREHNNANVLTLGAGLLGANLAKQIVKTWLETSFGGGRHAGRVDKIMQIEQRFTKQS
ncbi:MAG: ribose 5-phosphate isomerase B [Anaerolineales bacterium]|nr:ribose 5-phosphate isomerase B [Anaerolineales bacterium]